MSSNGMLQGSHLSWLSSLTSLEVLDLSSNYDLVGPIPTLYADLRYLDLSCTDLSVDLLEILLGFQKMSNLQYLDLSFSKFSCSIPTYVGNFSSLRMLDLSGNNLTGSIPTSIGNLIFMLKLDLSENSLLGLILSSIGNLLSLEILDLSQNMMNDNIPESLGRLSQLVELHLDSNNWTGILTEAHLISLRSLKSFKLTTDAPMSLAFNVTYDWVPPFNLEELDIENCLVGPAFSVWLLKQRSLTSVIFPNTGISDIIPDNWFSFIASDLNYLDLSSNKIRGTLPRGLVFPNLYIINLSYNQFEGEFPNWSFTAATQL
ncbi:receptor-like protein EIX2 isoform X1 [Amaranthus tricolor]|uniref:receptor-like protein EIX2 isoform X1 n=1 Tax=Amaranthus tricolor TaxID=29722 RepID=UPI00258774FA|nr:receptor-like protein EIX2 isoform X1 [Amaranthus tricolor]